MGSNVQCIDNLVAFLSKPYVSSLFTYHPNAVGSAVSLVDGNTTTFTAPEDWHDWWDWAAEKPDLWKDLVNFNRKCATHLAINGVEHADSVGLDELLSSFSESEKLQWDHIGFALKELIWDINWLSLPRTPTAIPVTMSPKLSPSVKSGPRGAKNPKLKTNIGMSPKKAHEVDRLTSYISNLLSSISSDLGIRVRHIVDVGAGQGYLSRALRDLSLPQSYASEETEASKPLMNGTSTIPLNVLALDSSPHQTDGAKRRQMSKSPLQHGINASGDGCTQMGSSSSSDTGSLVHRMIRIGSPETPGTDFGSDNLADEIDAWLHDLNSISAQQPPVDCEYPFTGQEGCDPTARGHAGIENRTPVLFVALHACGSLTPSLLRSFVSYQNRPNTLGESLGHMRSWYGVAAVAVGCCYNLMQPKDFPLSDTTASRIASLNYRFKLTQSHLQLAAQVPAQWFRTPETTADAVLAIRKVTFRAMLERYMRMTVHDEHVRGGVAVNGETPNSRKRLGTLDNRAYESFGTFLTAAKHKMGVALLQSPSIDARDDLHSCHEHNGQCDIEPDQSVEQSPLMRRLQVLHVLRCILGPAVESLILLDRYAWIEQMLGSDSTHLITPATLSDSRHQCVRPTGCDLAVRLVNLFDQGKDSGRNVGIVVAPKMVL